MKHIHSLLLVALLPVLTLLPACQETLPAYEEPDTPLSAEILINTRIWRDDLAELSPDFAVKVTNTSNDIDGWALPVPYDVSVDLSVFLARDPTRKAVIEGSRTFNDPIDDLTWGYYVAIRLDLPLTDDEGHAWNWGYQDIETLDLIIQGKVRIRQRDLEVNIPRVRTTLYFTEP